MSLIDASELIENERSTGKYRLAHIEAMLEALDMAERGQKISIINLLRWHKSMFRYGGTLRTTQAHSTGANGYVTRYMDHTDIFNELYNYLATFYFNHGNWFNIADAHKQFMHIHPFADGNGRIGRILLNWQAVYAGFNPVRIDDRNTYLTALENRKLVELANILKYSQVNYK